MDANKQIYVKLREMLHATNGRMAAMMGVSEATAKAYGNPSNIRRPSIQRLRQPIFVSGKFFRELQIEADIVPSLSSDDLEKMADKLLERLKKEAKH